MLITTENIYLDVKGKHFYFIIISKDFNNDSASGSEKQVFFKRTLVGLI